MQCDHHMSGLEEDDMMVACMAYLSQGMPLSQNLLASLHAVQAVLLLPATGRAPEPEPGSMGIRTKTGECFVFGLIHTGKFT